MKRTRRKIRWGRLLFLLLLLTGLVWGLVKVLSYAYQALPPLPSLPTMPAPQQKIVKTTSPYADKAGKRINLLLLGLDNGDHGQPAAVDAMLLLSLNQDDNSLNMLTIPRDTMVMLPGKQGIEQLSQAYSYGGPEMVMRSAEHLLQVPIEHYAVVDCRGFVRLVDLLGGVEVYVEQNMNYEDAFSGLSIHLNRGYQHLDGSKAAQYARYRSDELGELARLQRQQILLTALSDQLFQIAVIPKLPDIWQGIGECLITDLDVTVAMKMLACVRGRTFSQMRLEVLPGQPALLNGQSYWQPDQLQLKSLIEEMFYANNVKK